MTSCKVKVKWGKETYNDVELNTGESPTLFKEILFSLTGVQPDRQKLLLKGKEIKNDWNGFQIKDGTMLLMMGTPDPLPQEPVEKPRFLEDMDDNEVASALDLPAGLNNLGNTCYINATVQCLKTVPELREALSRFSEGAVAPPGTPSSLIAKLRDLYRSMDQNQNTEIAAFFMLSAIHAAFPRFAEKGENGVWMQQDANECWTELLRVLQNKLKPQPSTSSGDPNSYKSLVDQYFGGTFETEMKCDEAPEEPPIKSTETFLQLSCFISQEVKYLQSGLKLRLQETLTKHSPSLNRDAKYTKTSKICRLPAYLTVQFVRFFYKERESVSAKILKDIKFPLILDVFELCSESLQEKLLPMRSKFKEMEDLKVEAAIQKDRQEGDGKAQKLAESGDQINYHFEDDVGSNNSGFYSLQAVLTHKGRSSSSGHYVAWIKKKENEWFKCDDDVITQVSEDEITKLSGGGDWHTAYVLLYGPRKFPTIK